MLGAAIQQGTCAKAPRLWGNHWMTAWCEHHWSDDHTENITGVLCVSSRYYLIWFLQQPCELGKKEGKERKKRKFLFTGSVVQLLSCIWLFATPWTVALQVSLSFTISQNFIKLMSIESVMSSSHLSLCYPLLLLPSILPSIRVFSNESVLHIRWPN